MAVELDQRLTEMKGILQEGTNVLFDAIVGIREALTDKEESEYLPGTFDEIAASISNGSRDLQSAILAAKEEVQTSMAEFGTSIDEVVDLTSETTEWLKSFLSDAVRKSINSKESEEVGSASSAILVENESNSSSDLMDSLTDLSNSFDNLSDSILGSNSGNASVEQMSIGREVENSIDSIEDLLSSIRSSIQGQSSAITSNTPDIDLESVLESFRDGLDVLETISSSIENLSIPEAPEAQEFDYSRIQTIVDSMSYPDQIDYSSVIEDAARTIETSILDAGVDNDAGSGIEDLMDFLRSTMTVEVTNFPANEDSDHVDAFAEKIEPLVRSQNQLIETLDSRMTKLIETLTDLAETPKQDTENHRSQLVDSTSSSKSDPVVSDIWKSELDILDEITAFKDSFIQFLSDRKTEISNVRYKPSGSVTELDAR